MKNYKDIAILAAREAGKIHLRYFAKGLKAKAKSVSYNLVTAADIEAEKKIVCVIKNYFPEHNILAEEQRYKKTASAYTWVIDPLDGTSNFSAGLPIFCVSIALVKDGVTLVGVVYDPTRDELFYAEGGRGAYLNGKRIKVASSQRLDESLLITGFYYNRGRDMRVNLEKIKRFLLRRIIGIRRLGAAALDLCYVASGRAAGFWEFTLSPWDFAAGALIVKEAGGRVSDRYGQAVPLRKSFIVASNGKIHEAMLKVLR